MSRLVARSRQRVHLRHKKFRHIPNIARTMPESLQELLYYFYDIYRNIHDTKYKNIT